MDIIENMKATIYQNGVTQISFSNVYLGAHTLAALGFDPDLITTQEKLSLQKVGKACVEFLGNTAMHEFVDEGICTPDFQAPAGILRLTVATIQKYLEEIAGNGVEFVCFA